VPWVASVSRHHFRGGLRAGFGPSAKPNNPTQKAYKKTCTYVRKLVHVFGTDQNGPIAENPCYD